MIASSLACADPVASDELQRASDEERDDELGVVLLAITEVPADVRCLRVTIQSTSFVQRSIDVTGGAPSDDFELTGLPLGPATLSAEAFDVACGELDPSDQPSWVSDPVFAEITCKPPLSVTFVMRKSGRAHVGFDFQCGCEEEPLTLAVIGALGDTILLVDESGAPVSSLDVGLPSNRFVIGMDVRPATGQLYVLDSAFQLYQFVTPNFVPLGSPVPLTGGAFGFDFNPSVDRIRVISSADENLRLNPITGALVADDSAIDPPGQALIAAAYSNNQAGTATTVLYAISTATDQLVTMPVPNAGTTSPVGPLGFDVIDGAFDIAPNGRAFGAFTVMGQARLYEIALDTGEATELGPLPITGVGGLAVLP